jgi:hypothetical protein
MLWSFWSQYEGLLNNYYIFIRYLELNTYLLKLNFSINNDLKV